MTRRRKHTRKAQRPPTGGPPSIAGRFCHPSLREGRCDAPHAAQRGGASMPLAYYQDGAQMRGTYADPTGVGLASSTATMARTGISQTGGKHGTCDGQNAKRSSRHQNGGFAPSIMGQLVQNGSALLPVATYMGYKMLKGNRSTRRKGHKGSRPAHHSGSRSAHRGPRSTQKKRRSSRRR